MSLTGSTAIVTGGAIRIGRAIARKLAEEGINVCIQYHSSNEEAEETVVELTALGVKASKVQANFSDPIAAAQTIIDHVKLTHGFASILINSAAIFESGTLANTDETNWDMHQTINLKAPFFLTQAFVNQLPQAPTSTVAAVVNIVDWRGMRPIPGHIAYTIAKSGLVAQTKILAQELGPRVRVNGIAPGAILPAPGADPQVFEKRGESNPLKRVGNPQEIADAVYFILNSEFMTGEIIHITGGEQLGV